MRSAPKHREIGFQETAGFGKTAGCLKTCTDPENDAYMVRGTYRELTGIVQKVDPVVFCTITISGKDIPLQELSAISLPSLPDPADQSPVYTTADPWQKKWSTTLGAL